MFTMDHKEDEYNIVYHKIVRLKNGINTLNKTVHKKKRIHFYFLIFPFFSSVEKETDSEKRTNR
jgi:hypothetical protein